MCTLFRCREKFERDDNRCLNECDKRAYRDLNPGLGLRKPWCYPGYTIGPCFLLGIFIWVDFVFLFFMYKVISEGLTQIYVPVLGAFGSRAGGLDRRPPVFFNSVMCLNRGLTVLFMRAVGGGVFGDVLAGSGAKGLRVAVEAGCSVFLNDANSDAVDLISRNVELNGVSECVSVFNLDGNRFMFEHSGEMDFIDIDPFGSPGPFIDAALLASKKKGFIGVTATDTAALSGVYPGTCVRRYLARPLRGYLCHEVGLRILAGYVVRMAAKYDLGVSPVLSHFTRHYMRLYLMLGRGVSLAKESLGNMGFIYFCNSCKSFSFEQAEVPSKSVCGCGCRLRHAGPLWLGSLNDKSILSKMQSFSERDDEKKLLSLLQCELDEPFFYDVHRVSSDLSVSSPKIDVVLERLRNQGFTASRTHFNPVGVKTDASLDVVKKTLI